MGHHTSRKTAFVTTFAAAAIALMLAASDSIAIEATEIGPGPAGQAVSPAIAGKGEGPWAKAGSTLRRVFAAHSAHQQAGGGAPFDPGNPSIQFAKGLILIDAVAASDGGALLEDLRGLGLTGGTQYGAVVSGRIPLGLLNEVVALASLRGVSASLKPETNSAIDNTFGLVHDRRATIAMSLIESEADPQTYTGDGIKVGVLSDTFDNNGFPDYDGDGWPDMPATFAADDIANGDLPGGAGAAVVLHTPGDVDDDDKSAFGAIGTSGANATAGDATQSINLGASTRFNPASFNDSPVTAVVTYPDANQYTIGTALFSVEMWVNFETVYSTSIEGPVLQGSVLASQYSSSNSERAWFIRTRGPDETDPNTLLFWASPDGEHTNAASLFWPWTPSAGQWYHVAVTRDQNNAVRAFIDGQQIGAPQNLDMSIFDSSEVLRISSYDSIVGNNRPLDGWVEDFRFVVGEALYTSNFTPTGPLASELPPPPTPAATTTVLDDTANPGIDEGRAMMQLIHDVAPDASVSFHTAFNGMADFAQGIQDLADDGADIIVDDIIYFAEPMFQDGIVAQAVDNVVAQGKAYFSSAGNAARHSYESPFVASGERLTVSSDERGMLHDFDPGEGVDWKQSVTIPTGTVFTLVAQWDQPFASNCPGCPGSINDVDIYLVDNSNTIVASSIADNLASGEPVEVLQLQNTSGTTSYHILMTHYDVVTTQHPDPGPPPTLMKYVWFGHSSITVNEHTTDSPASYGHSSAVGAAAVGAAFYLDTPAFGITPPLRESYSSQGGIPILFDVAGNALGVPEVREKPEFVAPDGTNTTFFFRDTSLDDTDEAPETFPNFFGTSAAAPHAAAIAALMLEANPTLTPGDIYLILENTAVDMNTAGFDFDTGYGLIDATAALAQVTGGNLAPLAENDAASTDQNTLVSIPVLANDAVGDQPTAITLVTDPPNGTAVINDTSVDYTPDTDYFGPDSFDYTITDNDGETSVATVNVTVNEIDIQPIAVNDDTATDEDVTASNIDVMANDDPLGNAPTTITAAGPGETGSIVSTDGSTITYAPAADYNGIDTFPYTITDADGDSSNANLTVSVNPVNDDPVADNDATGTDEDTPANFDDALMLAGDTDVENDTLSIIVVDLLSSQLGAVTNHDDGTYTYTPPENFNGSDAIDYTVSDGQGGTDTASVVVTVNAVNDAPDAGSVVDQNSQDGDTGISVDASTSDIENDTLTYSVSGQPAGLSIDANTGEITGAIDGSASTGGPLSDGVYTVTVTASDASLGTDYEFTWTVSAEPVNGSPNAAIVADQNNQDGQAVTPVDASTTDPENDTLSYSVGGQPAGLSIDASSGIISGTLTNDASLGSVYTVTVTATDGISTPTDYQFTWTVTNPAPVAVDDNEGTNEDTPVTTADVLANDTDVDGDTLSVQSSDATSANGGTVTNNGNGTFDYTPAADFNGGDSFTYTVSDGNGGTDIGTVNVTVNAVNDGPVAADDSAGTNEDVAVVIDVLGNDSDIDGDGLSVSAVTQGANGSVTITNGGADVTYTPAADFNGGDSFTYTVSDGNGGTDTGTVSVTVNAVNDSPVAANDSDTTDQDLAVNIDVLGNDSDPDGDTLSVDSVTQGTNGSVTNNGTNVTYTPDGGFIGSDSFTYNVSDSNGGVDTATVNVTVNEVTGPPADAPTNVNATNLGGGIARITWEDSNSNEDGFELEREKQTGNGSWKSTTLIGPVAGLSYDDDSGKGTFRYRVRATNGSGTSGWSTPWAEVTVTSDGGGGNAAPTASYTYSCTDLSCDFDGSGSTDSDGTIASYSWDFGDGSPAGSGSAPNHVYAAAGTYNVTLTVTDDLGANGQDSQNVMVTEPSGGITLSATGYKVKGSQTVDLTWAGAATENIEVYRDGPLVATTANDGAYTDNLNTKGGGSYNYWICETDGGPCSSIVNVVF